MVMDAWIEGEEESGQLKMEDGSVIAD
ncbi:unnamed protein product [Lathyrus oleraceus]